MSTKFHQENVLNNTFFSYKEYTHKISKICIYFTEENYSKNIN